MRRRLMTGFLLALLLSATLAATDQAPAPKPDTVVVPWCEIWPYDILCWFWP